MSKHICCGFIFNHPSNGGNCLGICTEEKICSLCERKFGYRNTYSLSSDYCLMLPHDGRMTLKKLNKSNELHVTLQYKNRRILVFKTISDANRLHEQMGLTPLKQHVKIFHCDYSSEKKKIKIHYNYQNESIMYGTRVKGTPCAICSIRSINKHCINDRCSKCCANLPYNNDCSVHKNRTKNNVNIHICQGNVFNNSLNGGNCYINTHSKDLCHNCVTKFRYPNVHRISSNQCIILTESDDLKLLKDFIHFVITLDFITIVAFSTSYYAECASKKLNACILDDSEKIYMYYCEKKKSMIFKMEPREDLIYHVHKEFEKCKLNDQSFQIPYEYDPMIFNGYSDIMHTSEIPEIELSINYEISDEREYFDYPIFSDIEMTH